MVSVNNGGWNRHFSQHHAAGTSAEAVADESEKLLALGIQGHDEGAPSQEGGGNFSPRPNRSSVLSNRYRIRERIN